MDETTLTALKGSIAKWEAIVAGTGKDEGPTNCPLCSVFHPDFRADGKSHCEGCPVAIAGYRGCTNEEYTAYCAADKEDDRERMRAAATGELAFLKSLLPVQS